MRCAGEEHFHGMDGAFFLRKRLYMPGIALPGEMQPLPAIVQHTVDLQWFLQVQLPAIAPATLAGLRLGLAQGWLFLVAAELIASSIGLGFLLIDSQNTGRTDILLLAIVLLALLGKLTDGLLGVAERRLLRRWT